VETVDRGEGQFYPITWHEGTDVQ